MFFGKNEELTRLCNSCTINVTLRFQEGAYLLRHTQKACRILKKTDFREIWGVLNKRFLYSMHLNTWSWMDCQNRCKRDRSFLVCVRDRQRFSFLFAPWGKFDSLLHLVFQASLMYVGIIISKVSKLFFLHIESLYLITDTLCTLACQQILYVIRSMKKIPISLLSKQLYIAVTIHFNHHAMI